MKSILRIILKILNSWVSGWVLFGFCGLSFWLGELQGDMNLFAASGGVMTVFGLLSLIRFTTIEKYLNLERIVANSSGLTGPPVSAEKAKKLREQNREAARNRLKAELKSEFKGIGLTVIGTLIWAYGVYVPQFPAFR